MTVYKKTDKNATLGYSETQTKLVLQDIGKKYFALCTERHWYLGQCTKAFISMISTMICTIFTLYFADVM